MNAARNILIISDNDLLNQLYLINLQIYIGATVTIANDIWHVMEAFKVFKTFDLIISAAKMKEHEIGAICFEYMNKDDLKIPLILIGTPATEVANVTVIQTSYNLQNLLRSVASEFGITAKTMMEVDVPKFYPINLNYLGHLQAAPCMLYLQVKVSTNQFEYVLCAKKNMPIASLVKKIHSKGVVHLYVNSQDRLNIVNEISGALTQIIRGSATVVEKSDAISAGFTFAASQIIDNEDVVQEIIVVGEACSKAMEEVVGKVEGINTLMQLLMHNQQGYIYTHSMLAVYVARHIIKNVTWGGDCHIERINFMVFFHDIYLVPIYLKYPDAKSEEDLLASGKLTSAETQVLLNHARLAGEQVAKYKKCPSGIDLLIKQHHGMGNGVGFSTDFSDNISPLSKVLIIAESFVECGLREASSTDHKFKMDIPKAIEDLHKKYPKHTYRKIIDTLASIRI